MLAQECLAALETQKVQQSLHFRRRNYYLNETAGFFLRSCDHLPINVYDKSYPPNPLFQVRRHFVREAPFAHQLIDELEAKSQTDVLRWCYTIIEPGVRIKPHFDHAVYHFFVKRAIVELVPSSYVFKVEGEAAPTAVGEVYEFNNNTMHWGANDGVAKRVAVVLDYLPKGWKPW